MSFACANRWHSREQELIALYEAQDWNALAATVTELRFGNDLAWFYLGRAAEAMEAPGAARSYYERTVRAQRRCDGGLFSRCHGIAVTTEARQRGERLAELLAQPAMDLADAQSRLRQLGLYGAAVDGIYGPQTRAALVQFQRDRELEASGELDAQTIRALAVTATSAGNVSEAKTGARTESGASEVAVHVVAPARGNGESARSLAKPTAEGDAARPQPERTRVMVEVDLLAEADAFAPVLGVVQQGAWVDVIDSGDEWSKVSHENRTGYVYSDTLR